jgi:hypothetical protein
MLHEQALSREKECLPHGKIRSISPVQTPLRHASRATIGKEMFPWKRDFFSALCAQPEYHEAGNGSFPAQHNTQPSAE